MPAAFAPLGVCVCVCFFFNQQANNPRIQLARSLALAGAVVAAPAAGLVKMEVPMCLGMSPLPVSRLWAWVSGCRGSSTRPRHLSRSSLAHLRCTPSSIERRVRCVKMPLLLFLAMSNRARRLVLSSQAARSVKFWTRAVTSPNAPTTKPDTRPEFLVIIPASAGPGMHLRACCILRRAS